MSNVAVIGIDNHIYPVPIPRNKHLRPRPRRQGGPGMSRAEEGGASA